MKSKKRSRPTTKGLSPRAKLLYRRLRQTRQFYRTYAPDTPKAMQELVAAGLVRPMMRVAVIQECYVPYDAKPLKFETWRG